MARGRHPRTLPFSSGYRVGEDRYTDAEAFAEALFGVTEERIVLSNQDGIGQARKATCEILTPDGNLTAVERALAGEASFDRLRISLAAYATPGRMPTMTLVFAGALADTDPLPYLVAVLARDHRERLVYSNLEWLRRRGIDVERIVEEALRPRLGAFDYREAESVPTFGRSPDALRKLVERQDWNGGGFSFERNVAKAMAPFDSRRLARVVAKAVRSGNDPKVIRNIVRDAAERSSTNIVQECDSIVSRASSARAGH
jgi:hypothetical protein